jgi:MFS transporter, DHA1 family, multidrug resistance protein
MQTEPAKTEQAKLDAKALLSRSPRSIVFAVAVVAGLAELAYAVMNYSAMPVYLKLSLGKGADSVAWMSATFLTCEGVVKGPFGILGDRIGRKKLIIAGPLISVVTSLLTLLVHRDHWYLLFPLRILDGLGAAALWPSALAMIADVVEEDRRSQAMSLFNVTYMVGIGLGPFIGGVTNDLTHSFLPQADPRQASFFLVSLLFLLTAIAAYWRIPNIRPHHEHHAELESGFSVSALVHSLKQIPETLLLALVTFLGIGLILPLVKLFAMAEYRISETGFGALLLIPCLVIALASVPLGTIGDRIGKPRAIRFGLGLCAAAMWGMGLVRGEMALVIGGSLIGVGFVIAFPSWMAHVSASCDPRQRGAVMGAVGTAQGLGAMIGAPLGGYLYEYADIKLPGFMRVAEPSHYVPFIGCAALLAVAWLLAKLTIKDPPRKARV